MSTPETTPSTPAAQAAQGAIAAAPDIAPNSTPDSPAENTPESAPAKAAQPRNPLHGVKLETMVVALADYFGWDELGQRIQIRCFQSDPSVGSSLKFLRKTPWAREKVESLYLFMLRDQRRNNEG